LKVANETREVNDNSVYDEPRVYWGFCQRGEENATMATVCPAIVRTMNATTTVEQNKTASSGTSWFTFTPFASKYPGELSARVFLCVLYLVEKDAMSYDMIVTQRVNHRCCRVDST